MTLALRGFCTRSRAAARRSSVPARSSRSRAARIPPWPHLVARSFRNEPHPAVFEASVEVLARASHADAPAAFAKLCESGDRDPNALERAIEIALAAPSPRFTEALERALPKAPARQLPALVAAIGKSSGPRAVAALERLLAAPATSFAAAYALALDDSDESRAVLERALAGNAAEPPPRAARFGRASGRAR